MAPLWSSCVASLLSRDHLRRLADRDYGPSATPNLVGIHHIRRRRGQRALDPAPAWPRSMARTEEEEAEQDGHEQRRTEHLSSSRVFYFPSLPGGGRSQSAAWSKSTSPPHPRPPSISSWA